jgi:transposase-like protein
MKELLEYEKPSNVTEQIGTEIYPNSKKKNNEKTKSDGIIFNEIRSKNFRNTDKLEIITDEIAEILSNYKENLSLNSLTSLSDTAAKYLSKHNGIHLSLNGLTSLSDTAAGHLSKHSGNLLSLRGLTSLSEIAAEHLSEHEGFLDLAGLTSISKPIAETLSKHKGHVYLN